MEPPGLEILVIFKSNVPGKFLNLALPVARLGACNLDELGRGEGAQLILISLACNKRTRTPQGIWLVT